MAKNERLPSPYLSKAIDITRQIQQVSDRVMALNALIFTKAELLPETLYATRQILDEKYRAGALREIAQCLPETL